MGSGSGMGDVMNVATLGLWKATGLQEDFSGPDNSELDAMYMSQARETEKRIKALRANAYQERPRGIRSGGGQVTQGVPTLTSLEDTTTPKKSLFG